MIGKTIKKSAEEGNPFLKVDGKEKRGEESQVGEWNGRWGIPMQYIGS